MNFLSISPQFPDSYWNFCDRLARNGATVLGIGDTPYAQLPARLTSVLAEYYWLPSLEDYDQVFRAVAFLSYKHGKIDWVESNNEHWLALDARLREDFHVTTGAMPSEVKTWQSKALMRPRYAAAGVPTARQTQLGTLDDARWFVGEVGGFPVFAKPEVGVGAAGAGVIASDEELRALVGGHGGTPYVLEQLVSGDICSYDAILDSSAEPLFESQSEFPPSMAAVREGALDMAYWACPGVDDRLRVLGRAAAKAFDLRSRFAHLEFFRLDRDIWGLGACGDYVGLEVNARPAGGYTPDMMAAAHSVDVYQIWADMVCFDENRVPAGEQGHFFCVHASRRDARRYAHTADEVRSRYGDTLVMARRMPPGLADEIGDVAFVARLRTREEVDEFVAYVQAPEGAAAEG